MNYTLFHSSVPSDSNSSELTSPSFSSIQSTYSSGHVLFDSATIDNTFAVPYNDNVTVRQVDTFTHEAAGKKIVPHPNWDNILTSDFRNITPLHWLQYEPQPCTIHYVIAFVYTLILIPGFSANLLMITLFFRIPSLQTPSNLLNLNLAAADLLMNLQIPSVIYSSLRCKPSLGVIGCRAHGFFCGLAGTVAIVTISAMSLERYIKISQPFSSSKFQTYSNMLIVISFIWCYSLTFALIPLLFDKSITSYVPEGYLTTCSFDYLNHRLSSKIYIFIFFIGAYVLPLMIILYSYQSIICTVRRNRKSVIQGMLGSPKQKCASSLDIMAEIRSTIATNCDPNDKIESTNEHSEPVHSASSPDFRLAPLEVKSTALLKPSNSSTPTVSTVPAAGSIVDMRLKFLQKHKLSKSVERSSSSSNAPCQLRDGDSSEKHSDTRVKGKRASLTLKLKADRSINSSSSTSSGKKSNLLKSKKSLLNCSDKSTNSITNSNESISHASHRSKVLSPKPCTSKCSSYTTTLPSTVNPCAASNPSRLNAKCATLNNNISNGIIVCPIISPTPCTSLSFIQMEEGIKICEASINSRSSELNVFNVSSSNQMNDTMIQLPVVVGENKEKCATNGEIVYSLGVNNKTVEDEKVSVTGEMCGDEREAAINQVKCKQGKCKGQGVNSNQIRPISSASVHRYIESTSATERKLFKCSLVLISIWTIAWTPYAIVALIGIFTDASILIPSASIFPAILAKTASLCDPIVYSYSHPKYREIMSLHLRSIGRCICQPLTVCFSYIHYVLSPILYRRPYDARKSKVSVRRRGGMRHRRSHQLSKGQFASGFSDAKDFSNSNRTHSTSDDLAERDNINIRFDKQNKEHWSVLLTQSKFSREKELSLSRESTFSFTKTNSASGDTFSPRSQLNDSSHVDAIPLDVIIHTVNSDKSNHLSSNGPSRSS